MELKKCKGTEPSMVTGKGGIQRECVCNVLGEEGSLDIC